MEKLSSIEQEKKPGREEEAKKSPEQMMFEAMRNNPEEMEMFEDRNFRGYSERLRELRVKIEDKDRPEVKAKFIAEHGAKKVENDLQRSQGLEGEFFKQRLDPKARGKGPLPVIAEGMVATDFYGNDWFGKAEEEVFVTPASLYDDFFNKTDFVFELVSRAGKEGKLPSFIAALDVTIISPDDDARENTRLMEKFETLRGFIKSGSLGKFDYYESPRDHKLYHPQKGVPHAILMLPRKDVQDLLVWIRLKDAYPDNHAFVDYCYERLDSHPLRNDIRAQIYQFVYRAMRALQGEAAERQGESVENLERILKRLEQMGYPKEIADKDIRARMERYFPLQDLTKS